MRTSQQQPLREIVVFLPYEGPDEPSPTDTAHALTSALRVHHAAIGTDVLTGNVEIRLAYDAGIVSAARQTLRDMGVAFEIEVR